MQARLDYVVLFVLVFALAVYFQFTKTLGDPDGFYHAKMALFLSDGVVLQSLPWMQFSTLRDAFTDHHFLYHILLVPFVRLGDPLYGVKLATAFFFSGFFTTFYWTLKRFHIAAPWVYTVLLLITSTFTFRLSLIKANSISLIVLMFFLVALFERRWWILALLSWVYVWMYGGWLFSWVIVAAYVLVTRLHRRLHSFESPWYRRIFQRKHVAFDNWKAVPAVVGGSLAGIIINPYFPQNIFFYAQQIFQIAIVNLGSTINVGGEWSSLLPSELLPFFALTPIIFAVAVVALLQNPKKLSVKSWVFFILAVIAIAFTIKSRRYIELSAPLALLFSGAVWSDVFPRDLFRSMWQSWKGPADWVKHQFLVSIMVGGIVFLLIPSIGLSQMLKVHGELQGGIPIEKYHQASDWLKENTEPGSIIIHSDWDDWPMYFYYNDQNYYIIGLDPTFMYNVDADLYDRWADFTGSGEVADLQKLVTVDLRSEYVVVEHDHGALDQLLANNIFADKVYEDEEVHIYKITH